MNKLFELCEKLLKFCGYVISTILLGESKSDIKYIKKEVADIAKEMDSDIKPSIRNLNEKFNKLDKTVGIMKNKIDIIWVDELARSSSPLQLNERGQKIFDKSGIKKIIKERFEELYQAVKEKNPRNAYWVQEYAKLAVYKLKQDEKLLPKLEVSAYETGTDIDVILFVGSIYLRNKILPKFNCKPEDIDKHNPNVSE